MYTRDDESFSTPPVVFLKLWKSAKVEDKVGLIMHLNKRQVKRLKKENLLSEEEKTVAKKYYPDCFGVREFNQSELQELALMYAYADNIMRVKNPDQEFLEKWSWTVSDGNYPLKLATLRHIAQKDIFTWEQKLRIFWNAEYDGPRDGYHMAWADLKISAEKSGDPDIIKRVDVATFMNQLLTTKKTQDEEKDAIIVAFEEAYKAFESKHYTISTHILNAIDRKSWHLNGGRIEGTMPYDLGRVVDTYHGCIYNYGTDAYTGNINEAIQGVQSLMGLGFTFNDIKKCHLDFLLNNSEKILMEV